MSDVIGAVVAVGGVRFDKQISRAGHIAAQLVREGRITAGDLREEGFVPWSSTREESAARIEREACEYEAAGREVEFGDIAWFT
ncbi:hypothetical protein [Actinoalloteichus caeruleus]|uniref:hypothetical protein n=1 Tax=Actinoalloteichus cyanogriseus TaxID=2893586 RepID=UPI003AAEEB62